MFKLIKSQIKILQDKREEEKRIQEEEIRIKKE